MRAFTLAVLVVLLGMVSCLGAEGKPPVVVLDPLKHLSVEVTTGSDLVYYFHSWSSVGIGADWAIENDKIVKFVEETREYKNGKKQVEMPGGDDATGAFMFKALKAGTTKLTFRDIYRGSFPNTYTFEIIVKP